jgi:hypothetical protein
VLCKQDHFLHDEDALEEYRCALLLHLLQLVEYTAYHNIDV